MCVHPVLILVTCIRLAIAFAITVNDKDVLADSYAHIGEVCADTTINSKYCQLITNHFNEKVKEEPVRIAMTGLTGVGKSTLTNTLCGHKSVDVGSAPTCVNEECTGAKFGFDSDKGYTPPSAQSLRFIDTPGCNTAKWPAGSYVTDTGLDTFDAYMLVLTATRVAVSECELMLFKWMSGSGKPVYLVLNRINEEIDNPDSDEQLHEQEIDNKVEKSKQFFFASHLGPDPNNTFAVDARFKFRNKFDLPALQEKLIADVGSLFKMKLGGILAKHAGSRDYQAKMAVHIGAAAAGVISGFALWPGMSHVPNEMIQIVLIFVMANRYEIGLTMKAAVNVYLNHVGDNLIRHAAIFGIREASTLLNIIPLFGQFAKGSVAAAATESMGWKTRRMMRDDPSKVIQMAGLKPPGSSWINFDALLPTMECLAKELEDSLFSSGAYSVTGMRMAKCIGKQPDSSRSEL